MAASVVPSRARAAGRLPDPSASASPSPSARAHPAEPYHVRLILQTNSLSGPALSPAETYFLRWQRGTRQVKTSRPTAVAPDGSYAAKLSLYVTVRRAGPAFVPDDPADTLDSTLQVLRALDAPPVAETRLDIPGTLQALVQAARKSQPLNLALAPAVDLAATLSFTTLGGNSLAPYTEPGRPAPMFAGVNPHSALALSDPGEAAAAAELERLRATVREKEGRIESLADSTERLDRAVQEHARLTHDAVPAGDVAALHVRIKALEEEKDLIQGEKEEVEKKVAAHVAHAQKIRNTYNQLAGWYNNLRKEHVELQAKHPASSEDQGNAPRDLPQDVPTTHEADVQSLERERNELQGLLERERSEKKEIHSRNSQLLESKARTLAELREQWDAAQTTLSTTHRTKVEQEEKLKLLEHTVTDLQQQLQAKEEDISQRSRELAEATEALQNATNEQEDRLQEYVKTSVDEAKADAARILDEQTQQHREEIEQLSKDADITKDAALEEERLKLKAGFDEELEKLKQSVEEEQEKMYSEKLAIAQSDREAAVEEKEKSRGNALAEAEKANLQLEEARKEWETKISSSEKGRLLLEEKITQLEQDKATLEKERASSATSTEEAHRAQVAELSNAQDVLRAELVKAQEALDTEKQISSANKKDEAEFVAIQEELRQAKTEMEGLRTENAEMQSSPRDVQETEGVRLEDTSKLEHEISELRTQLRRESDKRAEVSKLLQVSDGEHDELRAMVTRLRSERDEAREGTKVGFEDVPNPEVSGAESKSTPNMKNHIDSCNFLEERDKALRELFRVRKGMKKEISRLKKENDELSRLAEGSAGVNADSVDRSVGEDSTSQILKMKAERDQAMAELQEQQARTVVVQGAHADELASRVEGAKSTIGALEAEVETLKETAKANEESLRAKISTLDHELRQEVSSSCGLSEKLHQVEASLLEEQSKLQTQHLEKEKETTRLGTLLENVKSTNSSLSTELGTEKKRREELQVLLSTSEAKLAKLEAELAHEQDTRREGVDTTKALTRERDQAQNALKEVEKSLEMSVMRVSDLQQELKEAKDRLDKLESSREFLQREASEVGGRNQAVSEEVVVLRADLKQTQTDLSKALRDLEVEVQKSSHRAERENASAAELKRKIEELTTDGIALQRKYDEKVNEHQAMQEAHKNLEKSLTESQGALANMKQALSEKDETCHRLESNLSEMAKAQEQANSKLKASDEDGSIAKRDLAKLQSEITSLRKEKELSSHKIEILEQEMGDMHERLAIIHEENVETVALERERADRETKKATDLRTELQNARVQVENINAEMEELQINYTELSKEKTALKEIGDERESELTKDLINTRVELAYAQEEAIRLRNKLQKQAQSGQGSLSFN